MPIAKFRERNKIKFLRAVYIKSTCIIAKIVRYLNSHYNKPGRISLISFAQNEVKY